MLCARAVGITQSLPSNACMRSGIHCVVMWAAAVDFLDVWAESLGHHVTVLQPLVLPVGAQITRTNAQHTILIHPEDDLQTSAAQCTPAVLHF
jgi:hypothetical protein